MRTFIATGITSGARLTRVLDRLHLAGPPVRPVVPERLHLTLQFFGDLPGEAAGPLCAAVDQTVSLFAAMSGRLTGLGAFPDPQRPRVLWAGVRADGLAEMQDHLQRCCAEAGFEADSRPFRPHVTLARLNSRRPVPEVVADLLNRHAAADFGPCVLDHLVLYRSDPAGRGRRWTELHRASFS